MFTPDEVFDIAVRLEQNGEKTYRSAADKMAGSRMASLLSWMANEETAHARWFSDLKQQKELLSISPLVDKMARAVIRDLLDDRTFSLEDTDFSSIREIDDLIAVFIEFEKDTILFYEMLESFVQDPKTRQQLSRIIQEEMRHIRKLQEMKGKGESKAKIDQAECDAGAGLSGAFVSRGTRFPEKEK